jgi:hypothetical protein
MASPFLEKIAGCTIYDDGVKGAFPNGLGMDQGVRTGISLTVDPNEAYGEWAGIVDSRNSAPPVPFP